MKVILIDDSNSFRELMHEFLTISGYEIDSYSTIPQETLKAQLFLVDWNIKDKTSSDLIIKIRKDNPKSHIYVLTGNILMSNLKSQIESLGVTGIINKPIDPDDLLNILEGIKINLSK